MSYHERPDHPTKKKYLYFTFDIWYPMFFIVVKIDEKNEDIDTFFCRVVLFYNSKIILPYGNLFVLFNWDSIY